jgi:hypothetical protein
MRAPPERATASEAILNRSADTLSRLSGADLRAAETTAREVTLGSGPKDTPNSQRLCGDNPDA